MDRTCPKCQKTFSKPSLLKQHVGRRTPCAPVVEKADLPPQALAKTHACKYCGRRFTTPQGRSRHLRESCKIANSDEGMDKLMEHVLQRQLAEQGSKVDALQSRVAELATLLKSQLALPVQGGPQSGVTVNGLAQINQNITIVPWDGDRRIYVDVRQIAAAFSENSRLKEYARMGDHELTDPEIAPPYVTELFVDLVKRGHEDPAARNVYLNPHRADQALVHMKTGRWEILPLENASRFLLDGVAKTIHRVTLSSDERQQLPPEAQNALALAGMMYGDEPEEYVKRVRLPMAAHLANTAPSGASG
jgi:hypothetical protein